MTGPILEGSADLVKARFDRSAGRVTLLTARPLLSAFFPELARFTQPLGGIVAARRSLLRNIRFENDYGVDIGLLIDAATRGARIAEAHIGWIDHENQSLEALSEMAKQITRVILDRAWKRDRLSINQVRDMEEMERRTRSQLLPPARATTAYDAQGRFALFDMDGVLLDGRFVVDLADRVGAQQELSRLLDNPALPDDERSTVIASLFAGVSQDAFEETARSIPLSPGAADAVDRSAAGRLPRRHSHRQLRRRGRDRAPPRFRRLRSRTPHALSSQGGHRRTDSLTRHDRPRATALNTAAAKATQSECCRSPQASSPSGPWPSATVTTTSACSGQWERQWRSGPSRLRWPVRPTTRSPTPSPTCSLCLGSSRTMPDPA